ncbi:acyl-CoA synthetase (AMP-forming)/AMP-acid ligase II [Kerstersia gyiorum]|uniref:AMP-binding protein n=1 Tax=Kerstersia gyiorum TaxID=206506 RepID=UPI0020A143D5|nr:AMP-binding protein [Kerstersia gyiorum]MCP1711737.1 acyl-CoA synthetase (AMP-forming)/AMP-acid ligase II [Kerstersia gyiorum]
MLWKKRVRLYRWRVLIFGALLLPGLPAHAFQTFADEDRSADLLGESAHQRYQFNTPTTVTYDPDTLGSNPAEARIYVADMGNHRIQVLDLSGRSIGTLDDADTLLASDSPASSVPGIQAPLGIAFLSRSEAEDERLAGLYVNDVGRHQILFFRTVADNADTFQYVTAFGTPGSGAGDALQMPRNVVITPQGYMVVSDEFNHRIKVFRLDPDQGYQATLLQTLGWQDASGHPAGAGPIIRGTDRDYGAPSSNYDDYAADLAAVTPDPHPHADRDADSPWYLLYTSGTTSRPKGVIQTFRMMMANYLNIGLAVRLSADDILLNVLPVFHTAGINLYSSGVLMLGGTVLVQRSFDAEQALEILSQRATLFFGVPAIYQALLAHPGFDGTRLQRVRSWSCGGAAMPAAVSQRYADAGILVRTGMGMTEAGPTVFLLDEDQVLRKPGAAGRPQLVTEVRIVDRNGRDVEPGEAGELLVRGPGVTPGYWQRPDATAETMLEGGWLRTGDVARCDEDGDYTIVDRWKDMFISGGENVYPAEVEAVLLQHPAVAEVAVVGMADERWGEVGHASVVIADGADTPDAEALRRFCRERLAGYKVPKVFQVREALPRNAMGKVIKQELRDAARH